MSLLKFAALIVELYADFENRVTLPCVSFRISVFVDDTHARGLEVLLGKRTEPLGKMLLLLQLLSSIKLKFLGVGEYFSPQLQEITT